MLDEVGLARRILAGLQVAPHDRSCSVDQGREKAQAQADVKSRLLHDSTVRVEIIYIG